jgi:hypothetical protein
VTWTIIVLQAMFAFNEAVAMRQSLVVLEERWTLP